MGRVGEKGKCGAGMNLQKRELWKAGKCTTIPWAVFVDQIKPLPEPIPIYLCYISFYVMRKEKKNPIPNLVPKLVNGSVPLVQPELLATKYPGANS